MGGLGLDTNTKDSGIYVTKEGVETQIAGFEMPKLDLPNIIIKKSGLHKGESAIFTLQREGAQPFNVKATCSTENQQAIVVLKLQKPGTWTVTETSWAWAHTAPNPNYLTKVLDKSTQETCTIDGKSITGTLFQFSDPDKPDTPTHGFAMLRKS